MALLRLLPAILAGVALVFGETCLPLLTAPRLSISHASPTRFRAVEATSRRSVTPLSAHAMLGSSPPDHIPTATLNKLTAEQPSNLIKQLGRQKRKSGKGCTPAKPKEGDREGGDVRTSGHQDDQDPAKRSNGAYQVFGMPVWQSQLQ